MYLIVHSCICCGIDVTLFNDDFNGNANIKHKGKKSASPGVRSVKGSVSHRLLAATKSAQHNRFLCEYVYLKQMKADLLDFLRP